MRTALTKKPPPDDADPWTLTPDRSRWDVPDELAEHFTPWSDADLLAEARQVPGGHPDPEGEARRRLHARHLLQASYRLRSEVQAADMAAASRCVVTGQPGTPTVPGVIPVGLLPAGGNALRRKVMLSDTVALAAALLPALRLLEDPATRAKIEALVAEHGR